jgi:hypothetical protein
VWLPHGTACTVFCTHVYVLCLHSSGADSRYTSRGHGRFSVSLTVFLTVLNFQLLSIEISKCNAGKPGNQLGVPMPHTNTAQLHCTGNAAGRLGVVILQQTKPNP